VKFEEFDGAKFLGLKKLTLNNMVQDPSMIHEALTYELFRAAGVAAPRTGYARVRVDGTDDEGDEADTADLDALITALGAGGGSFSARLASVADLDEMASEWAVEKYAGAWDNYTSFDDHHRPNNYYLHSDASGRFSMLPWGIDEALSTWITFDGPGGLLFEGCRGDAACWERFRQALATLPGRVTALDLDGQFAAQLETMLDPYRQDAVDERHEWTRAEFHAAVAHTRQFLELRPDALYDEGYWVAGPPLGSSAPPNDPPAADTQPPETTLTAVPRNVIRSKRAHVRARFRFESSEQGSTFECRLDQGVWKPCSSPARPKVERGRHRFRVVATDAAGNADPTPAIARFRLRPR
jgi:CotH kinase protein